MTYHSVEEIFAAKEAVLQRLEHLVSTLADLLVHLRPSSGAWSIEEIVEHLAIVEGGLVQLVESLLKKAEMSSGNNPGAFSFTVDLDAAVEQSRTVKFVTRDKFKPTGKVPVSDSLGKLRNIQTQLLQLRPRLESVDPARASFPHWTFGSLNLGQWLAFAGLHEERHLAQIEEMLASPEFMKHR
jgi:hypothetical protein